MRLFSKLYKWIMECSKHPHAAYYLFGLSFAESSVFPIPPDVMLAPMALSHPNRAWNYASLTTIASVLGGLFGYAIGMYFFKIVHPYIIYLGYEQHYQHIVQWFGLWGFWVMFFAGFAFIPYKLFTIAAGATAMPLLPFVLGSLVGRGGRFFLVTLMMVWGGERMQLMLEKYVERLGWAFLLLFALGYLAWHFFKT